MKLRTLINENIGKKHTNQVSDIIKTLNSIKSELSDPNYTGWGVDDIKNIIDKSLKEINKLPRIIKSNTTK